MELRKNTRCYWFRTTAALNTKIGEVENKIPYHTKCITALEFNKFAGSIFDMKLNEINLATNSEWC